MDEPVTNRRLGAQWWYPLLAGFVVGILVHLLHRHDWQTVLLMAVAMLATIISEDGRR